MSDPYFEFGAIKWHAFASIARYRELNEAVASLGGHIIPLHDEFVIEIPESSRKELAPLLESWMRCYLAEVMRQLTPPPALHEVEILWTGKAT